MEQLTATAERAASPIENLPAELLEQLLLYVVGDVVPPVSVDSDARRVHRVMQVKRNHVQLSLAFRLSCKKLYACSWRALGSFLGETVFDIRSRESCDHLLAVSQCENLAPWITKLTLACHQSLGSYPADNSSIAEIGSPVYEQLALIRRGETS
jgi:hypothetical protein